MQLIRALHSWAVSPGVAGRVKGLFSDLQAPQTHVCGPEILLLDQDPSGVLIYYLCQGDYVFIHVCSSVCLFVMDCRCICEGRGRSGVRGAG